MSINKRIVVNTPVGHFVMHIAGTKVIYATFNNEMAVAQTNHPYAQLVLDYFEGNLVALDQISRQQSASPFFAKIYEAMSAIPVGQTASYAELAHEAGSPRAMRAVGSACARNQLPLLVPCHRVVRSDGTLGNYGYGLAVKQWLLDHEARHAI